MGTRVVRGMLIGVMIVAVTAVPALADPPEPVDDWSVLGAAATDHLGGSELTSPGDWVAPEIRPLSPFGGDSQLPPDALASVTLEGVFDVVVSTEQRVSVRDPGFLNPVARLDVRPGGGFALIAGTDFGFPENTPLLPPTAPGDGARPLTLEDLVVLSGFGDAPDTIMGSDPVRLADDLLLVPTGYPQPTALHGSPVLIRGGRVAGELPLDGCGGHIIELGAVDLVGDPWSGPAPNDIFAGASHATVTRCQNGSWQPAQRLVNRGSFFEPAPSAHTITLVSPNGWLQFTPLEDLGETRGTRLFAFTTPLNDPYRPDTVGFTAWPEFPELSTPADAPWLVQNPFPSTFEPAPAGVYPVPVEFTAGTCTPEDWSNTFELYLFSGGDPGSYGAHMVQLDTGQMVRGDLLIGPDGIGGMLAGGGPDAGYTEAYEFGANSYTHANGEACTWRFDIDASTLDLIIGDLGTVSASPDEPENGTAATDDGETPTDGGGDTETPAATEPVAVAPPDESAGAPIWPFPLIVIGLGLITGGTVVTVRNRRRVPAGAPPGQLGTWYGEADDGTLTIEDLEQYADKPLSSYTDVYTPEAPAVTGPDDAWNDLLLKEDRFETLIERDFERVTTALTTGYSSYLDAVEAFRTAVAPVMSATVDMDRSLVTGSKALATAKTADFLWAVLTLTKSVGTIGFKAYKWLKTPKAVTGSAGLARAADELGVDLQQFLSRFDDEAVGASELLLEVAKRRGWKMMPLWSEWTLKRILYNLRSAQAGRVAHIPYDDIATLRSWAQRPGFWDDLAVAANAVRYPDGTVEDIALAFTKQDIDFLKAIAGADDLAHVLDDVPEALKAPGAFSGPVQMPLTYYLSDEDAYAWLWRQQNADTVVPPYAGPPVDSTAGTFLDRASAVRGSGASAQPFRGVNPEGDTLLDFTPRFDPAADTLLDLPPTGFHPGPPPGFNPHADTLLDGWRQGWDGIPPTNWDRAPTWVDGPIPPTNWHTTPTVIDAPIPPTNWQGAPTVIDMPIPPTNWQRADTVVSFRFPGGGTDVSVDFFSTQPTLLTHAPASVDEAASIASAVRNGPGGTLVLGGAGSAEVALRVDPTGRLTTATLPDGSVVHGPDAIRLASENPEALVAVHGPDAAASAIRNTIHSEMPFYDPARMTQADFDAMDVAVGQGLVNRAAAYTGMAGGLFSAAAGPGETPLVVGSILDPGFGLVGYSTPAGVESHVVVPMNELWDIPTSSADSLFSDVGVDPDLWMGSHGGDPFAGMNTLLGEVGQRRGWHPVTDRHRTYLESLIEDARRWAAGAGDPIDSSRIDQLAAWASRPGFFPWLLSSVASVDDGYLLLFNADDAHLLQSLLLANGDRQAFRERLGPIRVAAYTAVATTGATGGSQQGTGHRQIDPQQAHFQQVLRTYLNATHTSRIGLDQFLRSFGVVNEIDRDFKFWFFGTRTVEAGDTATLLNAWWSFFSSPIETYTSWYWTAEAHEQFLGLLDTHRDHLGAMVRAAAAAVRALDGLQSALGVIDDPASGFGAAARDGLRGVAGEMAELFRSAPDEWQNAHRDRYLRKQGHIRTKLANLESALQPLQALRSRLPQLIAWLNALRLDHNGELRLGYQLIDPEFVTRLGSVALALQGLANPALFLDTAVAEAARGRPAAAPRP